MQPSEPPRAASQWTAARRHPEQPSEPPRAASQRTLPSELLMRAVERGDLSRIEELIEEGADPSEPVAARTFRPTPLHLAAHLAPSRPDTTVFDALLAAKSLNIDVTDAQGWTPLHELLRESRSSPERILPLLRILARAGADINARTNNGETPLHLGAALGVVVVAELISMGATLKVKTRSGCNAVSYAVEAGRLDAVRFLVAAGEPLDAKSFRNSNCSLIERSFLWPELFDLIASAPPHTGVTTAAIVARNAAGRSPLATEDASPVVMRRLIALGADVHARDSLGATPLFWHCYSAERLQILLDAGADVNAQDDAGNTVLHTVIPLCQDLTTAPLMDVLLSAGANPELVNADGRTARDVAAYYDVRWVCERLWCNKIR